MTQTHADPIVVVAAGVVRTRVPIRIRSLLLHKRCLPDRCPHRDCSARLRLTYKRQSQANGSSVLINERRFCQKSMRMETLHHVCSGSPAATSRLTQWWMWFSCTRTCDAASTLSNNHQLSIEEPSISCREELSALHQN